MTDQEMLDILDKLIEELKDRISTLHEDFDDYEDIRDSVDLLVRNVKRLKNIKCYFESIHRILKVV